MIAILIGIASLIMSFTVGSEATSRQSVPTWAPSEVMYPDWNGTGTPPADPPVPRLVWTGGS